MPVHLEHVELHNSRGLALWNLGFRPFYLLASSFRWWQRLHGPLKQRLVASPVGRLLFPERHQPADRDAPNIFIVDKGSEHGVILRLRLVLWDYCVYAAIYLAASFWLVQAAWPWLAPLGHYRDALLGLFD
jgi:hypothetical protein